MTTLEKQVTILLGLTGTLNVLDAVEHIKTLKYLLKITEQQRKEWADMVIKKQSTIDELKEREEYLNEMMAEYMCDFCSLQKCVSKIMTITNDKAVIELINYTNFHLCINMK